MGGVDSEGSYTPGVEGLCQERQGLLEVREVGEGAAGRAGKESGWAYREGGGRRKGTPGIEAPWGLYLGQE
jgi:hypothetical protein